MEIIIVINNVILIENPLYKNRNFFICIVILMAY